MSKACSGCCLFYNAAVVRSLQGCMRRWRCSITKLSDVLVDVYRVGELVGKEKKRKWLLPKRGGARDRRFCFWCGGGAAVEETIRLAHETETTCPWFWALQATCRWRPSEAPLKVP